MDNIGSSHIQFNQPAAFGQTASSRSTGAGKGDSQTGPLDTIDLNKLSQLKDDEKISLIIEAKSGEGLEELKKKFVEQNPQNRIKADLPLINGFCVEIDKNSLGVLPELSKVTGDVCVFLDEKMSIPDQSIEKPEAVTRMNERLDVATKTMGLDKVWAMGFKGQNTTVCVIDTGIAPHDDLKDKVDWFEDMIKSPGVKTDCFDDQGHGSHCSSIVGGTGAASDKGKYTGAAPECRLVGLKVLDANGSGSFSTVIQGIQRALELKKSGKVDIDIISMSLGGPISQPSQKDPVVQAVEKAWEEGIIVCVAAGNSGPGKQTIASPANAEKIITVGAMDDKGTIDRSDDGMAYFSSRGPTKFDGLIKPDIIAPGVNIKAADAFNHSSYVNMSGTSMATPFDAGALACVVSAAKSINRKVSPDEIKELMLSTAVKLQDPKLDENQQGKGAIDAYAMVNALVGKGTQAV